MTDTRRISMTKAKKIVIGITVPLAVIVILVLIVFCPRVGKSRKEIWAYGDEYDISEVARVEKTKDEDFKILLFTDLQLWAGIGDNKETYRIMDELVEKTQPDLIILPGDNVSGIDTDILTLSLIKKMESYNIPWAPVFGNHDAEGNATLSWQGDKFENAENCLFSHGPTNLYGDGNYFVNVWEGEEVIYSLALMDNGRYYDYGDVEREIYIGYEQIAWFEWNINGVNKAMGKSVPSMVFSHFALPEFATAIKENCVKADDGRYYVPEDLGFGSCAYIPGAAPVNSGFFDKAKTLGTTHIFCGHDHENDASITYEDVVLTYGLKTGPSPAFWNDALQYGGTVITINDNGVSLSNEVICNA